MHELSVYDVPVIVPSTSVQPSVPLSERSSLYDTAPPTEAVQDKAILVVVGFVLTRFVGELGSVVAFVVEDGAEVPDTLTADTL